MRRALILLAVVSGLLSQTASAQVGIWLQKGVSGIGVSAGMLANSDEIGAIVGFGYSYQGFLDFELSAIYNSPHNSFLDENDLNIYGIQPGMEFHFLKQSAEFPISVSLSAYYTRFFFQSSQLSDAGIDITSQNVSAGLAVYRFFKLASNVGVIPAVGVSWVHAWVDATGPGGSVSNDDDTVALNLGGYLAIIDQGGRIYGIVPSVAIPINNSNAVTFGISFNIIWSLL